MNNVRIYGIFILFIIDAKVMEFIEVFNPSFRKYVPAG
jgi:hypothetical protein